MITIMITCKSKCCLAFQDCRVFAHCRYSATPRHWGLGPGKMEVRIFCLERYIIENIIIVSFTALIIVMNVIISLIIMSQESWAIFK